MGHGRRPPSERRLLIFIPVFGLQLLPGEVQRTIVHWLFDGVEPSVLVFGVLAVFAVLDVALLLLAMVRFQSARLILS